MKKTILCLLAAVLLSTGCTRTGTKTPANAIKPVPTLVITANDKVFYAHPEDNASAQAFLEKLSETVDGIASEHGAAVLWDEPLGDERRG